MRNFRKLYGSGEYQFRTSPDPQTGQFSEQFWYILIGIVATLTIVVIFVIIFLLRHNKNGNKHNQPVYSQGDASEDLFDVRPPRR